SKPLPIGLAIIRRRAMRPAIARQRRCSSIGRRNRSRACGPTLSHKGRGVSSRRSSSAPNAKSASRRRCNATWQLPRVHRTRCLTTSTPGFRMYTGPSATNSRAHPMPEVRLIEAINLALARAMQEDMSVLVLGEDVGVNGGVFRATLGLQERFGPERVIDTPLAELLISGLCVGMAAQGLRPVGEIQFMGFLYPCIDQLVNHASRLRHRTQGRLSCPMVLRAPCGAGIRAPEHHSESTEAMLTHIPGLRVVVPSSPERAYGLLLAAIRDPDPVIFLEPTRIYRAIKGEVEDDGEALPLDVAFLLRQGRDVTLISWGAMLKETLAAADLLADEGIAAEVIDLATLKPYDEETILASVQKTGRCVIVHEAARTAGFGAEIAALIAERALLSLLAPVARVPGYDTIVPLPRLEQQYLPSVDRIAAAARKAVHFS